MPKGNNWSYCGQTIDNTWSLRYCLPFCWKLQHFWGKSHSYCLKNMIHYAQITLKISFKLLWCKMYLCSLLFLFSLFMIHSMYCRDLLYFYYISLFVRNASHSFLRHMGKTVGAFLVFYLELLVYYISLLEPSLLD